MTALPQHEAATRSMGDMLATLTGLVRTCREADLAFSAASTASGNPWMAGRLDQLAGECRRICRELLDVAGRYDVVAPIDGDPGRSLPWREQPTARDGSGLELAERGEDVAVAEFVRALEAPLPHDVEAILRRQYARVLAARDEVRRMRDAAD